MNAVKKFIDYYNREINQQNSKQLIVTILCGTVGILWPLGGLLIFLISLFTKDKFYGRLALVSGIVALLCKILSMLVQTR